MHATQGQSKRFEEQVEPDVTLTMTDLNKLFLSDHGTLPRAAVFVMSSVFGLSFLLQVSLQMLHSFAQLFILVLEHRDDISSDFLGRLRPRIT